MSINTWTDADTGLIWYDYDDPTNYMWDHIPYFEDEMEGFNIASVQQYRSLINFDYTYDSVVKVSCPLVIHPGLYWAIDDKWESMAYTVDFKMGEILVATKRNKFSILVCKST